MGAGTQPRAVVSLVVAGRRFDLGGVDAPRRCDLELVDDLLRLQLIARRFGWVLEIRDVRSDLRELFDAAGLTGRLAPGTGEPAAGEDQGSR